MLFAFRLLLFHSLLQWLLLFPLSMKLHPFLQLSSYYYLLIFLCYSLCLLYIRGVLTIAIAPFSYTYAIPRVFTKSSFFLIANVAVIVDLPVLFRFVRYLFVLRLHQKPFNIWHCSCINMDLSCKASCISELNSVTLLPSTSTTNIYILYDRSDIGSNDAGVLSSWGFPSYLLYALSLVWMISSKLASQILNILAGSAYTTLLLFS